MTLCRVAQLESYPEKYNQSKYIIAIPQNSSLLLFKPFMHQSLIRLGGRIKHADLPLTLNIRLSFPTNIERYMHTGRHHILSLSREHYWISKACSLARKIVSSCFTYK